MLNCPHCGAEHPEERGRFCEHCGLAVAPPAAQACPHCDAPLPEGGGRFCDACGMSVVAHVRREDPELKAVTEEASIRCRFCGTKASRDAGVCPSCGNKLPTDD